MREEQERMWELTKREMRREMIEGKKVHGTITKERKTGKRSRRHKIITIRKEI